MSLEEQKELLEELEKRISHKKRRDKRKPCISTVDYVVQDDIHSDFTQNISAGGVFIGTAASLSVGQEITLSLFLPVSNDHMIVSGEIAWANEDGIGVKFKPSDDLQEETIKNLVDMI
jgi:Tfp pilus assembly protein PilZ